MDFCDILLPVSPSSPDDHTRVTTSLARQDVPLPLPLDTMRRDLRLLPNLMALFPPTRAIPRHPDILPRRTPIHTLQMGSLPWSLPHQDNILRLDRDAMLPPLPRDGVVLHGLHGGGARSTGTGRRG